MQEGAAVRVAAGELWETSGPVTGIEANPLYLDVTLREGASFSQPIPQGHTVLAYVFDGAGYFGPDDEAVQSVHMIQFGEGNHISARSDEHLRFILLAGAPFREPIVPYGPFVMNTESEVRQAFADYRSGNF